MRRSIVGLSVAFGGLLVATSFVPACGGTSSTGGFQGNGSQGSSSGSNGASSSGGGGAGGASSSGGVPIIGGSSGGTAGSSSGGSGGGVVCPSTMQCNVQCSGGGTTTTITGTVLDPAGVNPLYNIVAYVPSSAVGQLPSGVPTGADACSCSALFQGNPIVYATTDTSGNFTIPNAPVGQNIPLVIQVGKWRKQTTITTTACTANSAGKITLPKNGTEGDLPDIAVSTGGADSLECLMRRIGLDASEYVPGWTQSGHVHIFNGGSTGGGGIFGGGGGGSQEKNLMSGAPNSYAAGGLWDSAADLMKNDIVLLSCEGGETAEAIPANLESYLNAGGRAFASHFHYAWFNGSLTGGYSAPADWGSNLADWTTGSNGGGGLGGSTDVGGEVVTTLTGGGAFPKGLALKQWLTNLNSLTSTIGTTAVSQPELPVAEPRYNANVTTQKPSQPWIQLDTSTDATGASAPTLYFSFDTPIGGNPTTGNGAPLYCGRAVFSGLHVGGASYDGVNCTSGNGGGGGAGTNAEGCNTGHVAAAPPPTGCDTSHPLSPQEQALEFMLFDLSSCVVPDTVAPTDDAGAPIIPK